MANRELKTDARSGAGKWTRLPAGARAVAEVRPGTVLLETARFDAENRRSYLFLDPVEELTAWEPGELPGLFARMEQARARGCYAAGWMAYECGYGFVSLEAGEREAGAPLAWFGVYGEAAVFDHAAGRFLGEVALPQAEEPRGDAELVAGPVELGLGRAEYGERIAAIQELIAAGDTYQANFTDALTFAARCGAAELLGALLRRQPVSYGALIHTGGQAGGRQVVSCSPELFFAVDGRRIVTRPMKGTMARGRDGREDAEARARLARDEKNCAEHVMIVDLLRNDLGRLCETGSVQVERLFAVETYATLLQMTSTIAGRLRGDVGLEAIFGSLFPSGSVTGAPKRRTMEILREAEQGPRGVYTGAIGFVGPGGVARFSVPIRTLVLEQGRGRMGVGSGIVADSRADAEYDECVLKAAFLTEARPRFELIETLKWQDGYWLLEEHMERLAASAEYFGFAWDGETVRARLQAVARGFAAGAARRVRLLLSAEGAVAVESAALEDETTCRVRLEAERTQADDLWLRHKTTRRERYDRALQAARAAGWDEVLFRNERGELTEGAISNVFVEMDGRLWTPPLGSGVLPGVLRGHLLAKGEAAERVLTVEDLEAAEAVFVGNSVRGLRRVTELALAEGRELRWSGETAWCSRIAL